MKPPIVTLRILWEKSFVVERRPKPKNQRKEAA